MPKAKNTNTAAFVADEPEYSIRLDGEYQDAAVWNGSNDPYFTGPGLAFHELDAIGTDVRGKPVLALGENVRHSHMADRPTDHHPAA